MVDKDEPEDLIIAPVPALVAVLINVEKTKGRALTEAEVIEYRDNAQCIAMPRHAYEAVVEARGYEDINPENVWAEWLDFKAGYEDGSA